MMNIAKKPTAQQRAQAIIDEYRGLPGEFYMLKGILVIDGAIRRAYVSAGASKTNSFMLERGESAIAPIDHSMIAQRMDELMQQYKG